MTRPTPQKPSRFFLLLAAILALTVVGLPGMAWAAIPQSGCDGTQNNPTDQLFINHQSAYAQDKIQAAAAMVNAFSSVDIRANTCWTKIQSMFAALTTVGLNPLVTALLNTVLNQIIALAGQLCQAAMGVVSQLQKFVTSQISSLVCLPAIKLGLTTNLKLNLPNAPPCNGISLLTAGPNALRTPLHFQLLLPQSTGH